MGVTRFVIGFTLLVLLNPFLSGACNGPRNVNELTESLYGPGSSYSKLTRPNMAALSGTGQAVNTAAPDVFYFQIQFNQLIDIDTKLQRYTVDVWTREVWYDWRLRHNDSQAYDCFRNETAETFTAISAAEVDKIWQPRSTSKAFVGPPVILDFEAWISSNGRVWLTKRQLLQFSCFMDFTFMPYDIQSCPAPIQVMSYYSTEVALVPGIEDGIAVKITPRQASFVGGAVDWKIRADRTFGTMVCEDIGAVGGCTSFLKLRFVFQRRSEFYQRNYMLPVLLCVILSYSSFFISRSAVPARVAITAITFLTLSSRLAAVVASLPNLPGDVWLLDFTQVSLFFSLFANIEYVFVNYLLRMDDRTKTMVAEAKKAIEERAQNSQAGDQGTPELAAGPASQSYKEELVTEIRKIRSAFHRLDRLNLSRYGAIFLTGQHIDLFSRYAFFVAYAGVLAYFYFVLPADE